MLRTPVNELIRKPHHSAGSFDVDIPRCPDPSSVVAYPTHPFHRGCIDRGRVLRCCGHHDLASEGFHLYRLNVHCVTEQPGKMGKKKRKGKSVTSLAPCDSEYIYKRQVTCGCIPLCTQSKCKAIVDVLCVAARKCSGTKANANIPSSDAQA